MAANLIHTVMNVLPHRTKYFIEWLRGLLKHPRLCFIKKQKVEKPIVLVSFPRSGSSWVGSIIGNSKDLLYMREPITTPYLLSRSGRISVFEPEKCQDWRSYERYIDNVFAGNAKSLYSIQKFPEQWYTPEKLKRLLIKEVNPLVISNFQDKAHDIVYLLRHPYAVMESYHALRWREEDQFTQRFGTKKLNLINQINSQIQSGSSIQQLGYLQGWIEINTKQLLNNAELIIRYEDLCQKPIETYKSLFLQLDITFDNEIAEHIHRSLSAKNLANKGEFSLQRAQEDVAFVKVKHKDKEQYLELLSAYHLAFKDFNGYYNTNIEPAYSGNSALIKWVD